MKSFWVKRVFWFCGPTHHKTPREMTSLWRQDKSQSCSVTMLPAFQWEDGVAGRASGYRGNSGFHILLSHRTKTWLGKLPFSILLSAAFNSTWTVNFQMFKLDLEKAEEPEIKLPTSVGSLKKQENSRKTSTSALLTMPKPLTVWITINCGKFWKRWEY